MQSSTRSSWITGDIFTGPRERVSLSAWEPWEFARHVLFELQNSDIDDEHPEWRLHWFSGVTILRTIGHVLHNVDAQISDLHSAVINNLWRSWKSDKDANWIFFDFIEKERNNILKEFSFGAALPSAEDGRLLAYGQTDLDATQLFREAVYWWRYQLNGVERQLV